MARSLIQFVLILVLNIANVCPATAEQTLAVELHRADQEACATSEALGWREAAIN